MTTATDTQTLHQDKYNDPRARITRRGVLIGVSVFLFGILGAAASIVGRRTRIEKTTAFWGSEAITALQLAEHVHLLPLKHSPNGTRDESDSPIVLTAMPGLGHLRRALLDQRNYEWSTAGKNPPEPSEHAKWVRLRLTDPTARRIDNVQFDIELESGFVTFPDADTSDGLKQVYVNDRTRPALRHFLDTIMTVEEKRYDYRN